MTEQSQSAREVGTDSRFLGLDLEILEKTLVLIRDKYHLATQANVYLELNTGTSGINIGITNQRDAITHLVSLLQKPGDRDQQLAQLANLEEHLRRAIMEPYEKAVDLLQEKLLKILNQYKETVLTLPDFTEVMPGAPTLLQVNTSLKAIDDMRAEGRLAKKENAWTDAWENGVKCFNRAVVALQNLSLSLEAYVLNAAQIREARLHAGRGKRRAWLFLPLGAGLGLLLKILWDLLRTGHI